MIENILLTVLLMRRHILIQVSLIFAYCVEMVGKEILGGSYMKDYERFMELNNVLCEDCLSIFNHSNIRTIINDGRIVGFEEVECEIKDSLLNVQNITY